MTSLQLNSIGIIIIGIALILHVLLSHRFSSQKTKKEIKFICPVCMKLKPFSQFAQKKGVSIDGTCEKCFKNNLK